MAAVDGATTVWSTATAEVVTRLDEPCGTRLAASAVAMSRDGKHVACASLTVTLSDAATGKTLRTISRGTDAKSVAFSDDGRRLVTGERGALAIWNVDDGALVKRLPSMPGDTYAVALSPDGALVAASTLHHLRVFDIATNGQVPVPNGHEGEVFAVAFSPDGTTLATAGRDGKVLLWEPRTGALLRTLTTNRIAALAWSRRGHLLATASDDRSKGLYATTMQLHDVTTDAPPRTFTVIGQTEAIAFGADDAILAAVGSEGGLRFVDATDGREIRSESSRVSRSRSLALSKDGSAAYVGLPMNTAAVQAFAVTPVGYRRGDEPLRSFMERLPRRQIRRFFSA